MAAPLRASALYDYASTDATHLAFKAGATIEVLRDQEPWALGRLDGKTGWFPSSYVKKLAPSLAPPSAPSTAGGLGDLGGLSGFGAPMQAQPMSGMQQQRMGGGMSQPMGGMQQPMGASMMGASMMGGGMLQPTGGGQRPMAGASGMGMGGMGTGMGGGGLGMGAPRAGADPLGGLSGLGGFGAPMQPTLPAAGGSALLMPQPLMPSGGGAALSGTGATTRAPIDASLFATHSSASGPLSAFDFAPTPAPTPAARAPLAPALAPTQAPLAAAARPAAAAAPPAPPARTALPSAPATLPTALHPSALPAHQAAAAAAPARGAAPAAVASFEDGFTAGLRAAQAALAAQQGGGAPAPSARGPAPGADAGGAGFSAHFSPGGGSSVVASAAAGGGGAAAADALRRVMSMSAAAKAGGSSSASPIWRQPSFAGIFAGVAQGGYGALAATAGGVAVAGSAGAHLSLEEESELIRAAFELQRAALLALNAECAAPALAAAAHGLAGFVSLLRTALAVAASRDDSKLIGFVADVVARVNGMRGGESLALPGGWAAPSADAPDAPLTGGHLCLLAHVVTCEADGSFTFQTVNGERGREYHGNAVDAATGRTQFCPTLTQRGVPRARLIEAPFWVLLYRLLLLPDPRHSSRDLYNVVLPFLNAKPALANVEPASADWRVEFELPIDPAKRTPRAASRAALATETAKALLCALGLRRFDAAHAVVLGRWGLLMAAKAQLDVAAERAAAAGARAIGGGLLGSLSRTLAAGGIAVTAADVSLLRAACAHTCRLAAALHHEAKGAGAAGAGGLPATQLDAIRRGVAELQAALPGEADDVAAAIGLDASLAPPPAAGAGVGGANGLGGGGADDEPEGMARPSVDQIDLASERAGAAGHTLLERLRAPPLADEEKEAEAQTPILLPVELSLIADSVDSFEGASACLHHAVHLCNLLSNQRDALHHTYARRAALIGHVFTRTLPLPLPLPLPHAASPQPAAAAAARGADGCFWRAGPMRGAIQSQLLRSLQLVCEHYACACFSLRATRSFDAERLTVMACIAAVADAVLRAEVRDTPSLFCTHYAGLAGGPTSPFGFELGRYAIESESLELPSPRLTLCRAKVLRYFLGLRRVVPASNCILKLEDRMRMCSGDALLLSQLCLASGFPRGPSAESLAGYMSGEYSALTRNYPELALCRDIVFFLKLLMVPTTDSLPELRAWAPSDATLSWAVAKASGRGADKAGATPSYEVKGFRRQLDCAELAKTGREAEERAAAAAAGTASVGVLGRVAQFFGATKPRAPPSGADPSTLVGAFVGSEDDVLGVKALPDFDGRLRAREAELLLCYLTAPYLRIPLLLSFFAHAERVAALCADELQAALDGALFEPGLWQEARERPMPELIPPPLAPVAPAAAGGGGGAAGARGAASAALAASRAHLATPAGLLFNELLFCPEATLTPLLALLTLVLELDTGHHTASHVPAALYVIRLAVRVEAYATAALDTCAKGKAEAEAAFVHVPRAHALGTLRAKTDALRALLRASVAPMLSGWLSRAFMEADQRTCCVLHAHLAVLHGSSAEVDAAAATALVTAQVFILSNHELGLDVGALGPAGAASEPARRAPDGGGGGGGGDGGDESSGAEGGGGRDGGLGVPVTELMNLFQAKRVAVLAWLGSHPEACGHILEATVANVGRANTAAASALAIKLEVRSWVSLRGWGGAGRFVPEVESALIDAPTAAGGESYESWLRRAAERNVRTEINVQLGQLTLQKHHLSPLPGYIRNHPHLCDAMGSLPSDEVIQCIEVSTSARSRLVRLPGLRHDIKYFAPSREPPVNPFAGGHGRAYPRGLRPSEAWVHAVFERAREAVAPANAPVWLPNCDLSAAPFAVLTLELAVADTASATAASAGGVRLALREIVVIRATRVVNAFDVVSHGRRWYRQLAWSSSVQWCLADLGPAQPRRAPAPLPPAASLLIVRELSEASGAQEYVPPELLRGALPDALLTRYTFWRSMLTYDLVGYPRKPPRKPSRGLGAMHALGAAGGGKRGGGAAAAAAAAAANGGAGDEMATANAKAAAAAIAAMAEAEAEADDDPHVLKIYLAGDPATAGAEPVGAGSAGRAAAAAAAVAAAVGAGALALVQRVPVKGSTAAARARAEPDPSRPTLTLLHTLTAPASTPAGSLALALAPLEALSHVLLWTAAPVGTAAERCRAEMVELPRLRLRFRARQAGGGGDEAGGGGARVRLFSDEHTGMFISGSDASRARCARTAALLAGLPHVLLEHADGRLAALVSGAMVPVPRLPSAPAHAPLCAFVPGGAAWVANMGASSSSYLYAVHPSRAMLSAPSAAAALHLLSVRLLRGEYARAVEVVRECGDDSAYGPAARQLFERLCGTLRPTALCAPDLRAVRLRLGMWLDGSAAAVRFPWPTAADLEPYVVQQALVSATCRLSAAEERGLLEAYMAERGAGAKPAEMENRLGLLRALTTPAPAGAAAAGKALAVRVRPPPPPEAGASSSTAFDLVVDRTCLLPDKSSWASGFGTLSYTRPENDALEGTPALGQLRGWLRNGLELGGGRDSLGFLFLYELLTGSLNFRVLPTDSPYAWGCALVRCLPTEQTQKEGALMSILRVLANNPALAASMPKFEDTRKFKISTIFKGQDIVKTLLEQVKAHLASRQAALQWPTVPALYRPADTVRLSLATVDAILRLSGAGGAAPAPGSLLDGPAVLTAAHRLWLAPSSFAAELETAGGAPPLVSFRAVAPAAAALGGGAAGAAAAAALVVSDADAKAFASLPLGPIGLATYVGRRPARPPGTTPSALPFDLSGQPLARTAVGRATVKRLGDDLGEYARSNDAGGGLEMLHLLEDQLGAYAGAADSTPLQRALAHIGGLRKALRQIAERDRAFVAAAVLSLPALAAALPAASGTSGSADGDVAAHALLREAGAEPAPSFGALLRLTLSTHGASQLADFNPYLSRGAAEDVLVLTLCTAAATVRGTQAGRCDALARELLAMLRQLEAAKGADGAAKTSMVHATALKARSLAAALGERRHYAQAAAGAAADGAAPKQLDARLLAFEFAQSVMLREVQVTLLRSFVADASSGQSVCQQLLMGQGKTTVIGPALALLLATRGRLVVMTMPAHLVGFSRLLLRERLSGVLARPVYVLHVERSKPLTQAHLDCLRATRERCGVVVCDASSLKSLLLKAVECLHILDEATYGSQLSAAAAAAAKRAEKLPRFRSFQQLLGLRRRRAAADGGSEVALAAEQAELCVGALELIESSVLILDEVDSLLTPLKSELNWPLGARLPLDHTPARWELAWHLLDGLLHATTKRLSVDFADSSEARALLGKLDAALRAGAEQRVVQLQPHLLVLDESFYARALRPLLARWALLWLRAQQVRGLSDELMLAYILGGPTASPAAAKIVREQLAEPHAKSVNLARTLLDSVLPHVLSRVNLVHYGLLPAEMAAAQQDAAEAGAAGNSRARLLLAIPYLGKGVPSSASEFSNADVLIGLSILAYRHQGLRRSDVIGVVLNLLEMMAEQDGPYKSRPACRTFARWVELGGGQVRGVALSGAATKAGAPPPPPADLMALDGSAVAGPREVPPLQLVDVRDPDLIDLLESVLRNLPEVIGHYMHDFAFPVTMARQVTKLSANGQDIGGSMLSPLRVGFSGTPNDLLPLELGTCHYAKGDDGRVLHVLTNERVTSVEPLPAGWDVVSVLSWVANRRPALHALIDTGAVITGKSNEEVARALLELGLPLAAVVFLNTEGDKLVLTRRSAKPVPLAQCGVPPAHRFTYYDQVNTTGTDIEQTPDARAAITLGHAMTFRDLAQGAFRMRGIGTGQTVVLLVQPEVAQLVQAATSRAAAPAALLGGGGGGGYGGGALLDMGLGGLAPSAGAPPLPRLSDVCAWLVLCSIRHEAMQFALLCDQRLANVWRKRAFRLLRERREQIKRPALEAEGVRLVAQPRAGGASPGTPSAGSAAGSGAEARAALQVFREALNFTVEASVPQARTYADTLQEKADCHAHLLADRQENSTVQAILRDIRQADLDALAVGAAGAMAAAGEAGGMQLEAEAVAEAEAEAEAEQQQEQQQQQQQQQQKEEELEPDEPHKLPFSRDDEALRPWRLDSLALPAGSGPRPPVPPFYPTSEFSVHRTIVAKASPCAFPAYLLQSHNWFHPAWRKNHRRVKNVIMMLEIHQPDGANGGGGPGERAAAVSWVQRSLGGSVQQGGGGVASIQLSGSQEQHLRTIFALFDSRGAGRLTREELVDALTAIDVDVPPHLVAGAVDLSALGLGGLGAPTVRAGGLVGAGGSGDYEFAEFKKLTCAQLAAVALGAPGRFFVICSLAEAEAVRGALHIAQSSAAGLGLGGTQIALLAHGSPLDMSPGCVTPFDYQAHVARQCARFVDSEAEYDERDAIALLRALRSTAAGARKTWFVDVRACRRRQQQAAQFASGGGGEARGGLLVRRRRSRRHGVPAALESLFNAPDEFALLEQAALLRRARTQLARRGLSARDAFALFNKSRSGNVSCRELAAGLGWLGMKLSVPQLHATMRVLDSTGEGELGADDFRAAFGARSDDDEEAGSAARAGAASAPPLVDALGGGGGGGGGGLTAAQGLGAPSGGLMGGGMVGLGMGGGLEEVQKTIKDTPHVPELGPLGGGGGRGGADAAGGGAAGGGAVDLRGFEVRVRKAKDFAEVWTAGAQTGPAGSGWSEPVSVWAPAADSTGLGKASVRLCVGHYPSREGNPAKARGAGRLIVELASASSTFGLAGLGATERFLEVARAVMPHPRRFKLVWSTLAAGKPLYVWRPIAPSAVYVALGFVATTSEEEPAPSCVHCVPAAWCGETREPARAVGEAGGVGNGSRPGSLWQVSKAGLLCATSGHTRPTDTAYDLREDIYRLDNYRPDAHR